MIILITCGAEEKIQSLTCVRQAFYHQAANPAENSSLMEYCQQLLSHSIECNQCNILLR